MTDRSKRAVISHVPFRIRVGVTGHRALPPAGDGQLARRIYEALGTRLVDVFDERSRDLVTSVRNTPFTFTVVSALAEGADRLVALEVLALPDSTLEAVLPFAEAEYLKDFETKESRDDFRRLIHSARRVVVLGTRPMPPESQPEDHNAARRQAYEDAGRHVVDNCDVLLALWDGRRSGAKGGTAAAVAYAEAVGRPVIVISTERPYELRIQGDGRIAADLLRGIEDFNSFAIAPATLRAHAEGAYREIFENDEGRAIPENEKSRIRENLLPYYVRASEIARQTQRIERRAGVTVYGSAILALSAVAIGTLVPDIAPYAFVLELLLLLNVLSTVMVAGRRRTHSRWVENRFLAERIRTSVFFASCGLDVSPIRVPAHLSAVGVRDSWMLAAFDEMWGTVWPACAREGSIAPLTTFVRRSWIREQIGYHAGIAQKAQARGRRLELAGILVFAMAVVAPAAHLLLFKPGFELEMKWLEELLTFTALLLPALGAGFEGIRSHREYSRLAKRSESMTAALTEVDRRFQFVDTPDQLQAQMREAEELMLVEAADWLALMHFTKLEPVA